MQPTLNLPDQSTQPMGLDAPLPTASEEVTPSGFEPTRPLDWEQQALTPDYDEIIAAIETGEIMAEPDFSARKRVLVVDDDVSARMYLRAKLALVEGIDVYEASSGDEALQMSEFTPFDGILLDVNMAGQDGYAVCRTIKRQSRSRGGKLPKIYLVTSRSGMMDRMRATLAGADAFISKPPLPNQLHELLAAI